jgi:protein-tyrosine phosphatase
LQLRKMGSVAAALSMSLAGQREVFARIQDREAKLIEGAMHGDMAEHTLNEALSPPNCRRNRYANVFPWDHTRVVLPTSAQASDYINASYIELSPNNRYIAAQGPLKDTAHHFWWMCYTESERQGNDTILIGMVTPIQEGGVVKCFQYWPQQGDPVVDFSASLRKDRLIGEKDSFEVRHVSENFHPEGQFLVTQLQVSFNERTKTIYHYYYDQWADCKVPPSIEPLIFLSKEVAAIQSKHALPPTPIIHCSAGVGRTGTFIALDYMLHLAQEGGTVSHETLNETISALRLQRMMMVQTFHQFNYLHRAVEILANSKSN